MIKERRLFFLLICLLIYPFRLLSQEYQGTTGLLHVPSAEMDPSGTFRGWGMFVDDTYHPFNFEQESYNSFCYGVGIAMADWIQLSYALTLFKMHEYGSSGRVGYFNQDRHANIKLRPLKEGRWWPAVAVGWDDLGNLNNFFNKKSRKYSMTGNNHFECYYVAATKHFDIDGHELGAHLTYRYYPSERSQRHCGLVGGVTFSPRVENILHRSLPSWMERPRFILEWDGCGVNAGADILLLRHLFVQASLTHGCGFTGGLSYRYRIKY